MYAVEQPEPLEEEEPVTKPVKKTTTKKEKTLVKGDGFDKEDGTYTGTGTGFRGTIKVSVQIKDRKITAIDILECSDDGGYVSRAKGVIEDIIAAQSLEVDTVSGATFSSRGILRAVKNALTGETDNGVTGWRNSENRAAVVSARRALRMWKNHLPIRTVFTPEAAWALAERPLCR